MSNPGTLVDTRGKAAVAQKVLARPKSRFARHQATLDRPLRDICRSLCDTRLPEYPACATCGYLGNNPGIRNDVTSRGPWEHSHLRLRDCSRPSREVGQNRGSRLGVQIGGVGRLFLDAPRRRSSNSVSPHHWQILSHARGVICARGHAPLHPIKSCDAVLQGQHVHSISSYSAMRFTQSVWAIGKRNLVAVRCRVPS
jgi:hypothetical protein